MHNNIIAAGSKDRLPMLATGRFARWRSRFLQYLDTKPNGDALRKCILEGPYKPTTVVVPAAKKEAIFMLLTGIGDEIYLTVDACQTANEIQKGKEVAKPVTAPSDSGSDEDSNPKQAQKDKEMQKNLALIAKYFKKLYKPTNNNLRTSSNSRNKTVDNSPRKPKQEVLPADSDNTAEPLEEVQYNDEYNVFANERQHSEKPESINNTHVLEKDDSNVIPDSSNMCNNDNQVDQNDAECNDEHAVLANLIANLTFDIEQNKKILKQLKKANTSLTQELKECKYNLEESIATRDSCLITLQTKHNELEKYIAFND
ncbi:hypothetical protein Tco_1359282 [Tanacetum coccineum]